MGAYYINFYFKKLLYDDNSYLGVFSAPDNDVYCEFEYDRHSHQFRIWSNNKPIDDILPLPIWFLDEKLEEYGKLNENESKISY